MNTAAESARTAAAAVIATPRIISRWVTLSMNNITTAAIIGMKMMRLRIGN